MADTDARFEFGSYRLDCRRRVLLRGGELVALPSRQLDILVVLVQQHGQLVEKDELMRRVWGGTVVEEGNLPVNVHALRRALAVGDDSPGAAEGEREGRERHIQTVPRRGYRFVAPVRRLPDPGPVPQPGAPAVPSARPIRPAGERPWRRRAPVALATMALTGLVVAAAWIRPGSEPVARATPGALAVLPFSAIRNGVSDDALGWGIADGVSGRLARQRDVPVRPGVATLKYPGDTTDPLEAGRALQADAIVQGTIRTEAHGVRVWAQLVRVADGARLWALSDDGRGFDSLERAGRDLAGELAAVLGVSAASSRTEPVPERLNPVAEELLLKGRHQCSHPSPAKSAAGLVQLEQAAALEPSRAVVHAALASCLVTPVARLSNEERMLRARESARRALQLDDRQPVAHAALALSSIYTDWDWRGARRHLEVAIEQSPQDLDAHLWSAMAHTATGQHDQALQTLGAARRIDPTSTRAHVAHGYALYMARRFDQAVDVLHKAPLDLGPSSQHVLWGLGLAHVQRGQRAEAFEALQRALTRSGHHPAAKAYLAYAHARFGESEKARALLAEIGDAPAVPAVMRAPAHACLGEPDRALALLEQALARRDYRVAYLGVDPVFDCLRNDPRLPALLGRMGLGR